MIFNKKTKNPEIKFRCRADAIDAMPHPVPAHRAMPIWFRELRKRIPETDLKSSGTVKTCVPVLDAVSQGYIIPLWADLHVKVTEVFDEENPDKILGKSIWCKFPDGVNVGSDSDISKHVWEQVGDLCDLKKFDLGRVLLKLPNPWVIETEKGWSVQIKNPSNNWSNDIMIIEGVVDTDEYHQQINLPYVWIGDEVGEWIIPKGTPIAQVIPFKRQKLNFSCETFDTERMQAQRIKISTIFHNRYRNLFWHKRKKANLDG